MNKPHKHEEAIKAWADGAEIEVYNKHYDRWQKTDEPRWLDYLDYRVKPKLHKWQKEIDAFAQGKTIQYKWKSQKYWLDTSVPKWNTAEGFEYRIKPESVVLYSLVGSDPQSGPFATLERTQGACNLKLTFEDGVLIKAEVI